MANDPYRILGLTPGASAEEVRRAYRGLAKRLHPDTAGEAATSRFLAVQAAYESIVGGQGGSAGRRGAPGGAARAAGRPSARRPPPADPARARASRESYRRRGSADGDGGARGGRPDASSGASSEKASGSSGAAPGGAGGQASASGAGPADGGATRGPTDRGGRRAPSRRKATLTSTSYDEAAREPFEPDWDGGAWYGPSMGTYWTINPKEYADPRKHGAEYQARARRDAGGEAAAVHRSADDAAAPTEAAATGDAAAAPAAAAPAAAAPAAAAPAAAERDAPPGDATPLPVRRHAASGPPDGMPTDGSPPARSRLPSVAADIVAKIRRRTARPRP